MLLLLIIIGLHLDLDKLHAELSAVLRPESFPGLFSDYKCPFTYLYYMADRPDCLNYNV